MSGSTTCFYLLNTERMDHHSVTVLTLDSFNYSCYPVLQKKVKEQQHTVRITNHTQEFPNWLQYCRSNPLQHTPSSAHRPDGGQSERVQFPEVPSTSHGFLLPEIPLTEPGGTEQLLLEQFPTNTSTLAHSFCCAMKAPPFWHDHEQKWVLQFGLKQASVTIPQLQTAEKKVLLQLTNATIVECCLPHPPCKELCLPRSPLIQRWGK